MLMAIKMRFLSSLLSLALLYQLGLVQDYDIQFGEQVRPHSVAWNPLQRRHFTAFHHWIHSSTRRLSVHQPPGVLGRPPLGKNTLLHRRRHREILLPDWRLRIWKNQLRRRRGAATPATLAEFTLDGSGGQDFYDVSLVDGYNLPMMVVPAGGSGVNCSATGCPVDLNGACPYELRVKSEGGSESVACKSACGAFNQPQYCCSGAYGGPDTCKPSSYSQLFKNACPRAYSYAYDDKTSTFVCAGSPDYTITFCPPPSTSKKASASDGQGSPAASSTESPNLDSSMVYQGAIDVSGAESRGTWAHRILSSILVVVGGVTVPPPPLLLNGLFLWAL